MNTRGIPNDEHSVEPRPHLTEDLSASYQSNVEPVQQGRRLASIVDLSLMR